MLAIVTTLLFMGLDPMLPPIQDSDISMFPQPMELARDYYWFAKAHVDWLWERTEDSDPWYREACRYKRAWDLLDNCKRIWPNDQTHINCELRQLRKILGPADFYQGRMPPPVPVHRFREIK